ncbi:retrovirus-related Pol polyprotein from transposon 17.6 [Trichonephila clavipes]|nr:retrovirus-related Pol polyprotein from transposon 17.6 [Trichonephila clavipes]
MIADQMKKRCSPECKEHYWISGKNLSPPVMLAVISREALSASSIPDIPVDLGRYGEQEQSSYKEKTKEEHPVEFASSLLNPSERNHSTTEREALAVVWALNKFRAYIDGSRITVASDHQPLKWLMKRKSPTGRLAR